MATVRIKIIKKFHPTEIFGKPFYLTDGERMEPCHYFQEGNEYFVDDIQKKPDNFCLWAWRDIYKDLSILFFEGNFPLLEPGMQHTSCSDGHKPVIFELRRLKD